MWTILDFCFHKVRQQMKMCLCVQHPGDRKYSVILQKVQVAHIQVFSSFKLFSVHCKAKYNIMVSSKLRCKERLLCLQNQMCLGSVVKLLFICVFISGSVDVNNLSAPAFRALLQLMGLFELGRLSKPLHLDA